MDRIRQNVVKAWAYLRKVKGHNWASEPVGNKLLEAQPDQVVQDLTRLGHTLKII